MIVAGRINEIWRYPIRSVGGERLLSGALSTGGLHGDREFVLIDAATGQPSAPEKDARWHPALHLVARRLDDGLTILTFPGDQQIAVDDDRLTFYLSEYFGFPAQLAKYDDAVSPYAAALTAHRKDHAPVHIVSAESMQQLGAICGGGTIDSRRLRPTLVIETGRNEQFQENAWLNRALRSGSVRLRIVEPTKRCGITFLSQPDLNKDPEILRNILRFNSRSFGVYADVLSEGVMREHDDLLICDD